MSEPATFSIEDMQSAMVAAPKKAKGDQGLSLDDMQSAIDSEPGWLSKAGSAVVGGAKAAYKAVVGENEFDYPEFTAGPALGISPDLHSSLLATRGEAGMTDVIKKHVPGAKFSKDKFGNDIVDVDGQKSYLNRGGASARDVDELGRDTLMMLPGAGLAGAALKGAPMAVRALGQAAAGAAGSGAVDALSAKQGSEQGLDKVALIASALGGATGEVLGSGVNALMTRIRYRPSRYMDNAGDLTPEGRSLVESAGFNPDEVGSKMKEALAARVQQHGESPAVVRQAAADEFGLTLTRGEATQDFGRLAGEEAAAHGARGPLAGGVIRNQRELRRADIATTNQEIADQVAPNIRTDIPNESAGRLAEGVRGAEQALSRDVSQTYKEVGEAGVTREALFELPNIVRSTVRGENRIIDPQTTPSAVKALELVENLGNLRLNNIGTFDPATLPKNMDEVIGLAIDAVENVRRQIGGRDGLLASAANPSDRAGVQAVVKGFNQWFDSVVDTGLLYGTPEAVKKLKEARSLAAKRFALFTEDTSKNYSDDAGKVIQRIVEDPNVTEKELSNFFWGSTKIGDSPRAFRVAQKLEAIVGKDSPEWEALKRGMVQKMTTGVPDGEQPTAAAIAKNIFGFVNGDGKQLANVMFPDEELSALLRYAKVLESTVVPKDAINGSRTAYVSARMARDFLGSNGILGKLAQPVAYIADFPAAFNAYTSVHRALPKLRTPGTPGAAAAEVAGQELTAQ